MHLGNGRAAPPSGEQHETLVRRWQTGMNAGKSIRVVKLPPGRFILDAKVADMRCVGSDVAVWKERPALWHVFRKHAHSHSHANLREMIYYYYSSLVVKLLLKHHGRERGVKRA